MPNIVAFDTTRYHVYVPTFFTLPDGKRHELDAILDTGAPFTEFPDQFLQFAGLIEKAAPDIQIKSSVQTQKYGKLVIPQVEICGHVIREMPAYISHFEKHWGVDVLIGLDFFRQFEVTISYKTGRIITEPC